MNVAVDREWFRKHWEAKGLTLTKTARLIGMDPAALSRTLKGERKMKLLEVGKIATILGVAPAEVLARMDPGVGTEASDAGGKPDKDVRISKHPGFGFMKGLIKIEGGFDVAGPFDDEEWGEGYLGEDRL